MIQIDDALCVGCGLCVRDCFPGALSLSAGSAALSAPDRCISCGHCIAVCPQAAVRDDSLEMDEAVPVRYEVDSGALLALMRSRRSCRHFLPDPVPEETLRLLIEAARACPTAKNLQATRYIAVTKKIPVLLDEALSTLGRIGQVQLEKTNAPDERRRAENFVKWSAQRQADPTFDPLFFHAPALLLFVGGGDSPRDSAAGAAWAELMAASLGLGCLYSGYFTACAAESPAIGEILGLRGRERVERCLVLGKPDIRFQRTAPRKRPDITNL